VKQRIDAALCGFWWLGLMDELITIYLIGTEVKCNHSQIRIVLLVSRYVLIMLDGHYLANHKVYCFTLLSHTDNNKV
jgi:hypothetical protein